MVCFPTVVFSGVTQGAFTSTLAAGALTANVVRDFFMNLFLHPGKNYIVVMALCAMTVAACVGLAFLIKMVYEKYSPDHT